MTGEQPLVVARSVPAIAENVSALRRAVTDRAERAGADSRVQGDIALAVGEACGNVVQHAYPPGETGPLVVEASVNDGELVVVVTDMGRGCVPRPNSEGLGLGLPLMTSVARHVTITDGEGGRGTEVRMLFPLEIVR
jgi:anti-sigma regulatory factor (Ser/Thr protein kinase)